MGGPGRGRGSSLSLLSSGAGDVGRRLGEVHPCLLWSRGLGRGRRLSLGYASGTVTAGSVASIALASSALRSI